MHSNAGQDNGLSVDGPCSAMQASVIIASASSSCWASKQFNAPAPPAAHHCSKRCELDSEGKNNFEFIIIIISHSSYFQTIQSIVNSVTFILV